MYISPIDTSLTFAPKDAYNRRTEFLYFSMNVTKTPLEGLLIIEPKVFGDDRGYFFESYQKERYTEVGVSPELVQDNQSKSARGILRGLHLLGPQYVIITDGKVGVYAYDGKEAWFVPSRPVKIIETTGAGDAYASGFVSGLIKTGDFKTAMKVGMVNAEAVLTHKGAKKSLLSWKMAMSAIRKGRISFHHLHV